MARTRHSKRAEQTAARRGQLRRRRAVALSVLAAIGLATFALANASGEAAKHAAGVHRTVAVLRVRRSAAAVSPGSLPQTDAFPSAQTPLFKQLMGELWSGVVANRVPPALPAFFPLGAYVRLKAIGDAASDWRNRLIHDYSLDIAAAHALLGRGAQQAKLLRVTVVRSYGHWVPPGVCDNGVGYYEMPNARVVYEENGSVRSFGIASLISWRGVWYVVHFGAILRSSDVGQVDDPTSGPGISAYSGTC